MSLVDTPENYRHAWYLRPALALMRWRLGRLFESVRLWARLPLAFLGFQLRCEFAPHTMAYNLGRAIRPGGDCGPFPRPARRYKLALSPAAGLPTRLRRICPTRRLTPGGSPVAPSRARETTAEALLQHPPTRQGRRQAVGHQL